MFYFGFLFFGWGTSLWANAQRKNNILPTLGNKSGVRQKTTKSVVFVKTKAGFLRKWDVLSKKAICILLGGIQAYKLCRLDFFGHHPYMLPHRPFQSSHFLKKNCDWATNVAKFVAKQHLIFLLPDLESLDPGDIFSYPKWYPTMPRHRKRSNFRYKTARQKFGKTLRIGTTLSRRVICNNLGKK